MDLSKNECISGSHNLRTKQTQFRTPANVSVFCSHVCNFLDIVMAAVKSLSVISNIGFPFKFISVEFVFPS